MPPKIPQNNSPQGACPICNGVHTYTVGGKTFNVQDGPYVCQNDDCHQGAIGMVKSPTAYPIRLYSDGQLDVRCRFCGTESIVKLTPAGQHAG